MKLSKLENLIPEALSNPSNARYSKVHDAFPRDSLPREELKRIDLLYRQIMQIVESTTYPQIWENIDPEAFFHMARQMGTSMERLTPKQSKAFHDLKGGAVFGVFTLPKPDIEELFELSVLQSLASDHAKLIRSLFPYLDPEKSLAEESSIQVHTMEVYLEPWRRRILVQNGKPVAVQVKNTFEGSITCRCIETSALDRTLLNLTNNAARFTEDSKIELITFKVENLVRWCVLNTVSDEQRQWLSSRLESNGLALFQRGLTRGGSGFGLESCTDVIGNVFGVIDKELLVERGYIGATMLLDQFCAWFHWPLYQPAPEDALCFCNSKNG